MAGRGMITLDIKTVAYERLGVNGGICQEELRLMPYVQYELMNNRTLDPNRINESERHILSDWIKRGWLESGSSFGELKVSKEFWDAMCEILWLGYVGVEL